MEPIIESILDNEYSSFLIADYALNRFGPTKEMPRVVYTLEGADITSYLRYVERSDVQIQMKHLLNLKISPSERLYLSGTSITNSLYTKLNEDFTFDEVEINVSESGPFVLTLSGPWYLASLLRVPILAVLSELYTTSQHLRPSETMLKTASDYFAFHYNKNLDDTFLDYQINYIDYSTKNRFSRSAQEQIIFSLLHESARRDFHFSASSNLLNAKIFGLQRKFVPTYEVMSFEVARAKFALEGLEDHNPDMFLGTGMQTALACWKQIFPKDLHAVAPSVYNLSTFFKCVNYDWVKELSYVMFNVSDVGYVSNQEYQRWESFMETSVRSRDEAFSTPVYPNQQLPLLHVKPFGVSTTSIRQDAFYNNLEKIVKYLRNNVTDILIDLAHFDVGKLRSPVLRLPLTKVTFPFEADIITLGDSVLKETNTGSKALSSYKKAVNNISKQPILNRY